jgi:hypothetical protein
MRHFPSTERAIDQVAITIARRCRHVVQACLREEEWADADREFYRIIRDGLEAYRDRETSALRPRDQTQGGS